MLVCRYCRVLVLQHPKLQLRFDYEQFLSSDELTRGTKGHQGRYRHQDEQKTLEKFQLMFRESVKYIYIVARVDGDFHLC